MFKFILKRILMVIPTFIAITFVTFALIHFIPGDPVEIMMGERGLTPEVHQQMMKQLGLDLPLYQQYFNYIGNVIQGDFGESFRTQQPVLREFFTLFLLPLNWLSLHYLVINCRYYVRNDCGR